MSTTYRTPGGTYSTLYADMAKQPHLLIAGATGSGKSVVENGVIHAILTNNSPATARLILVDPKRVELSQYKALPHTLCYASDGKAATQALQYAIEIMEGRYSAMQKAGVRRYDGADVYVLIDELADLMLTDKKAVQPLIQRIAQLGRAARIHLIVCTQCPLAKVIPTEIKCNLDARVGLRTRSAQDSRNILGVTGCESLPRYGKGFYMTPEGMKLHDMPLIPDAWQTALIDYWTDKRRCVVA